MASLGTTELLIILGIVLVLFGAKKLPSLSRGIADSIRELRRATAEDVTPEETKGSTGA